MRATYRYSETHSQHGGDCGRMTSPPKQSRLGLVVNGLLGLLAFMLLGLVIWQNSDKLGEVLRRRLDLRLVGVRALTGPARCLDDELKAGEIDVVRDKGLSLTARGSWHTRV